MRTTSSAIGRALAGVFLAAVLVLTMAGVASAQSAPSSPSSPSSPSGPSGSGGGAGGGGGGVAGTQFATTSGGRSTGNTGANLWIPLAVGGGTLVIALGTRKLLRSSPT